MTDTIRVGGVPEHFNLPWHLAIEEGKFEEKNLNIEWVQCDGGTGQMTKALRSGDCDLCVLLTEGIITDICRGNPSKIISLYVTTPLCWGIHTGAFNPLSNYESIYNRQYAISRFGSGSHLMAVVDAEGKNKTIHDDQWTIINNLDGALESLRSQDTDVFYWEKFTTKPYVDSGLLKRVGEYYTPWPCFVIAASDKILKERPTDVIRLLRVIHDQCDNFMESQEAIDMVASRYKQNITDVTRWYHSTEWAIHGWVSDKMLKGVVYHLQTAGILDKDQVIPDLVWKRD